MSKSTRQAKRSAAKVNGLVAVFNALIAWLTSSLKGLEKAQVTSEVEVEKLNTKIQTEGRRIRLVRDQGVC